MADENTPSNPPTDTAAIPAVAAIDPAAGTEATVVEIPAEAKPAEAKPAGVKKAKPAAAEATAEPESAEPAAKKVKAPALEDKPLSEFMAQDCLPELIKQITAQGIEGLDLTFKTQKIAVRGYESLPECWQIEGKWQARQKAHQFNVYFFDAELQGQRGFSVSLGNQKPSTMESFRIDERKMSLNLFISGVLQRLNGQKWLDRN